MALNHAPQHGIGEAEYLQGEMISDIRHEYIHGEIHAMAGASRNHQRISRNISFALTQFLEEKPCEPFAGEMKVKADNCFFYPDVLVVCGDEQGNDYYTDKPCIIIEVLSKTTRRLDQTTKLAAYKRIPSLQEYVLIEQDCIDIEVFRRSENWLSAHYFLGDYLTFDSIGLSVSVLDIYRRVDNEDMRDYLQQFAQQAM